MDRRQSAAEAMDTVLLAEKYSKMAADHPGACASDVKVIGVDLSGNPHVWQPVSHTIHIIAWLLNITSPSVIARN